MDSYQLLPPRFVKLQGMKSLNIIVTMDYWFENMWYAKFLREQFEIYELVPLNTGNSVTTKDELTNLLESKNVPWRNHVV